MEINTYPGSSPVSASNPFFQQLINNMPGLIVIIFDHELRYLAAAGQALQDAGYVPEQIIGKTISEVLPPDSVTVVEPQYRAALAGHVTELERHVGGKFYRSRFMPVRDTSGNIIAGMTTSEEITAQKQAELALAVSEARYRMLTEHTSDLILQVAASTLTYM